MKKWLVLAVSFLVISASLMFAGDPKAPSVAFTLATSGGDPGPISFTLAPRPAEPTALAGPTGAGVIEDPSGFNTAVGYEAFYSNTTGMRNTVSGYQALFSNTYSDDNTAHGYKALYSHINGDRNTAIGANALYSNNGGSVNVAVGIDALYGNVDGFSNTAIGGAALYSNISGHYNTAVGMTSLYYSTGSFNVALGEMAGNSCREGNYNIYIGTTAVGEEGDNNTTRIGRPYTTDWYPPGGQNRVFVAGIVESPFTADDVPTVVGISNQGRLGTMSSDLLPSKGDPGPQGPQGVPGPAGEGLVPGSLLFLASGFAPPAGYALIGSTELAVTVPGVKRTIKLTVNVYQKQ